MTTLLFVFALSLAVAATAWPAEPVRTSIFYYPWYGTPARDGEWQHWSQAGARPPSAIATAFYPARGVYSSSNGVVLAQHMREIAAAGVDEIATSWWGRESTEDLRLPLVRRLARAVRLDVALHIEPYAGRTPTSVVADIAYARTLGIHDVYVYRAEDFAAGEWAQALTGLEGPRVWAQTALVGFAARGRFAGFYTYDVLVHGAGKFARLCEQARRAKVQCAPSVGPGYDARRATGDERVKLRRDGRTYDTMWRSALRARADRVTITSYNEWHEGTQIEPARKRRPGTGRIVYASYERAWGLRGTAAERAYLTRTALWTTRARFAR